MTEKERLIKAVSSVTFMSEEEKAAFLKGAMILIDLGWPPNFDYPMTQRAIAGLVPKYEGWSTWFEYQDRWANEDNAARHQRDLAAQSAVKSRQP